MIESVFRTDNNYYPQVFLEKCKYLVKEKNIPKYIVDYMKFLLILIEKILMKKVLIKKLLVKEILIKKIFDEKNSNEEIFDKKNFKNTNITIEKIQVFFLHLYKNS